jgi:hypothetical protein
MIAARDDAEMLAIQILEFIGSDSDKLGRFLGMTGLEITSLREAAKLPLFLPAVLDYAAADSELLNELHAKADIVPAAVEAARSKLSPQADLPAPAKQRAAPMMPPRRSLFQ